MKFPGGNRFRRIIDGLFPAGPNPQDLHKERLAEIQAAVDAQEAKANELRHGCADRLRPHIGRLFLVNNFKSIQPEENATRVSRAILSVMSAAGFADDTPLGISAVLDPERGNHEEFLGSATVLRNSFEDNGSQHVLSLQPQIEGSDFWLLSLARAAEETAEQSHLLPNQVGSIAVVSALEMNRQADIPFVPAPGAVFRLTSISEDARFGWETVSVHPTDEWQAAAWEEMKRLQDPGNFQ